jgi:hypothetical protein
LPASHEQRRHEQRRRHEFGSVIGRHDDAWRARAVARRLGRKRKQNKTKKNETLAEIIRSQECGDATADALAPARPPGETMRCEKIFTSGGTAKISSSGAGRQRNFRNEWSAVECRNFSSSLAAATWGGDGDLVVGDDL